MVIDIAGNRHGISIPELARVYPISEASLYALANRGALPGARRLGHRIVVHLATFDKWMASGQGE